MLADLAECESEIIDPAETLWRQVPPKLCVDGSPLVEAFIPSTKDARKLSVGQGSRTSAEECFTEYTVALGCQSIGVAQLSVSSVTPAAVAAVEDEVLPVRVVNDAECDESPDWHGYVDFNGIEQRGHRKAFAQHLWLAAVDAGWAHGPEDL